MLPLLLEVGCEERGDALRAEAVRADRPPVQSVTLEEVPEQIVPIRASQLNTLARYAARGAGAPKQCRQPESTTTSKGAEASHGVVTSTS